MMSRLQLSVVRHLLLLPSCRSNGSKLLNAAAESLDVGTSVFLSDFIYPFLYLSAQKYTFSFSLYYLDSRREEAAWVDFGGRWACTLCGATLFGWRTSWRNKKTQNVTLNITPYGFRRAHTTREMPHIFKVHGYPRGVVPYWRVHTLNTLLYKTLSAYLWTHESVIHVQVHAYTRPGKISRCLDLNKQILKSHCLDNYCSVSFGNSLFNPKWWSFSFCTNHVARHMLWVWKRCYYVSGGSNFWPASKQRKKRRPLKWLELG